MHFDELITPCYIINEDDYRANISEIMSEYEKRWPGKVTFGYSVKTNHLPHMLKTALEYGWYGEVVSPDEYEFAIKCGTNPGKMIYNGPQKKKNLFEVIETGAIVNLDNLEEVIAVAEKYSSLSKADTGSFRIGLRVNFDLEKECPGETTCKGIVGRFGISYENGDFGKAVELLRNAGLHISGVHMHTSSSSRSLKVFEALSNMAVTLIKEFDLSDIDYVDIGGGFFGGNFFPGKPNVMQYSQCVCDTLSNGLSEAKINVENIELILEPGAAVLATSMDYLTSVLNIRDIRGEKVVTVDGSVIHINPMMNPHETPFTMINPGKESDEKQIVGGSTCMEMDRFYPRNIKNEILHGSKLLFHCCGAYMSTHNSSFINAAPNIYIKKDDDYSLLREKTVDSMLNY